MSEEIVNQAMVTLEGEIKKMISVTNTPTKDIFGHDELIDNLHKFVSKRNEFKCSYINLDVTNATEQELNNFLGGLDKTNKNLSQAIDDLVNLLLQNSADRLLCVKYAIIREFEDTDRGELLQCKDTISLINRYFNK